MSDPVTNADIEDVLAQVRRLVLQEQPAPHSFSSRPQPPQSPRPTPLHLPRVPARLVLTPAQRVGEGEEEAEAPEAPTLVLSPALPGAGGRAEGAKGIERAVGGTGGAAWEPDGSEEPDWTPGWSLGDAAEDGPEATPPVFRHRSRAAPSNPEPRPELRASPAAGLLDEERLRALVTEVVREVVGEVVRAELQGELGERVTRNLRKLVRREVFRVLDGQGEA